MFNIRKSRVSQFVAGLAVFAMVVIGPSSVNADCLSDGTTVCINAYNAARMAVWDLQTLAVQANDAAFNAACILCGGSEACIDAAAMVNYLADLAIQAAVQQAEADLEIALDVCITLLIIFCGNNNGS